MHGVDVALFRNSTQCFWFSPVFSVHAFILFVFCKPCKTVLKILTFPYQSFLCYLAVSHVWEFIFWNPAVKWRYTRTVAVEQTFWVQVTLLVDVQWKLLRFTVESSALCSDCVSNLGMEMQVGHQTLGRGWERNSCLGHPTLTLRPSSSHMHTPFSIPSPCFIMCL